MKQATLVSLYGKKDVEFAGLIADCQAMVRAALGDAFQPYAMEQIHATIVGLEHRPGYVGQNRNFWTHQQRAVEMDIDDYLNFLRNCPQLPFKVQIGGFVNRGYPFTSDPFQRGDEVRPYQRSFVIWRDKVVVMGWPVECTSDGTRYPSRLDDIRRAAQRFGILHSYHRIEQAVDNDLYFRIGLVDSSCSPSPTIIDGIRKKLSLRRPLLVPITVNSLAVAVYENETLPPLSTQIVPIAEQRLDSGLPAKLYD